jgi:hypothetical protein
VALKIANSATAHSEELTWFEQTNTTSSGTHPNEFLNVERTRVVSVHLCHVFLNLCNDSPNIQSEFSSHKVSNMPAMDV